MESKLTIDIKSKLLKFPSPFQNIDGKFIFILTLFLIEDIHFFLYAFSFSFSAFFFLEQGRRRPEIIKIKASESKNN